MKAAFLFLAAAVFLLSCGARAEDGFTSAPGTPLPIGAGDGPAVKIFPKTGSNEAGNVLFGGGSGDPKVGAALDRGLKVGIDEDITAPPSGITLPACRAEKKGTLSQDDSGTGLLFLCDGSNWVLLGAK